MAGKMLVSHYKINLNRGTRHAADTRVRKLASIAVIADLHDAQIGKENAGLIRAVEREKICAVLSPGDLLTATGGPVKMEHSMELIRRLACRWPVYLANGNHEMRLKEWTGNYPDLYMDYRQSIQDSGAYLLDDESRVLYLLKNGTAEDAGADREELPANVEAALRITGISLKLWWYHRLHRRHMTAQDLEAQVGPSRSFQILLAHHPEYFPVYAKWGADLTLSGHLHGGMIRLPGLGGVIGGTVRPFPRYDLGRFRMDGKEMIVSAGLSEHSVKLRWNNPPQLVILEIYK